MKMSVTPVSELDMSQIKPGSLRMAECWRIIGESRTNMYRRIRRREFFATRLGSWLVFVIVDPEKVKAQKMQLDLFD